MTRLTWLAEALRAEGATVAEYDNWQTRSAPTRRTYSPVGIMIHHTAPPVPFPLDNLAGIRAGRVDAPKCQINVKPDGTVWILAAGYAYAAGMGSSVVLDEVRRNIAPAGDAAARSLDNDTNGNPWFVNIEVDHPGDGSPVPAGQLAAAVAAATAVARHQHWSTHTIIGHREWTSRKIDPRWAGTANPMPAFRVAVAAQLGIPKEDLTMYRPVGYRDGFGIPDGDPAVKEWQLLLGFTGGDVDGKYGPMTRDAVAAAAGGDGTAIGPLEGAKIIAKAAGLAGYPLHVHSFQSTADFQGTTGHPD